jgi:hypothetical protein
MIVKLLTIYYFGIVAETTQVTSDIFTGIEVTTRNQDLVTVNPPAGTVKITTFFEDGSTQILTTIPTMFTLPLKD